MLVDWLFFLNADGRLVGPESAPYPNEARDINAAWQMLRRGTTAGWETELLYGGFGKTSYIAPASGQPARTG